MGTSAEIHRRHAREIEDDEDRAADQPRHQPNTSRAKIA
jgi:hypothetical protein